MNGWFKLTLVTVLVLGIMSFGFANTNDRAEQILDKIASGQQITQAEKELVSQYLADQLTGKKFQAAQAQLQAMQPTGTQTTLLGPEGFDTWVPTGWTVTDNGNGHAWGQTTNANYGGGTDPYAFWDDDSWGSGSADRTVLTSPAFSTVGFGSVSLTFDYGYRPLGSDTFAIDVSNDGGTTWQRVMNLPGTSSTTNARYPESVGNLLDITAAAGENPNVMIRFIYDDAGGWNWYGALDNVKVEGTPAGSPPNPATLVSPPDGGVDISILTDLVWADGGGGPTGYLIYFGTDGGGVTPPTNIENGTDLGNVTTYTPAAALSYSTTYYWQIVPYNGNGNATGAPIWSFTTLADPTVSSYPYDEDFETFTVGSNATGFTNNWSNDPTNTTSMFRWNVDNGGTPSSSTGPTVDHTLGTSAGIYLFTEASSGGAGDSAFVFTPPFDLSPLTNPVMEFWYHMYGAAMGEMHVDALVGGSWVNDIATPLIGQQQGSQTDPWLKKTVDLSTYAGQTISLRFRSYRGTSYTGDMAIDDFHLGEAVFQPEFSASPVMMDLNDTNSLVPAGNPVSYYVYISNTGFANLDVTGINTSTPDIVVSPTTLTVPPTGTDSVLVTWTPSAAAMDTAWIEFINNAASSPDTVYATLQSVPAGSYVVDFEADYATWFTPAGYGFTLDGASWTRTTNEHWGDYGAFKSGSTGKDTTYLYTPRLDLTSGPSQVSFYSKGTSTGDDSLEVLISTDLGATWTRVGVVDNHRTTFEYFSFDLSSFPQNDSTFLAFHYFYPTGITSGSSFYMDDLAMPPKYLSAIGILYASVSQIDFGAGAVGDTARFDVDLTNTGALLTINSITTDNPAFTVSNVPATIAPFTTETFTVNFAPTAATTYTGNVMINHNGVNGTDEILTIPVSGVGLLPHPPVFMDDFESSASLNNYLFSWTGGDPVFQIFGGYSSIQPISGDSLLGMWGAASGVVTNMNVDLPLDLSASNNPIISFAFGCYSLETGTDSGWVDIYDGSWHLGIVGVSGTSTMTQYTYNVNAEGWNKVANFKVRFRGSMNYPMNSDGVFVDNIMVYEPIDWANLQWPPATTTHENVPTELIFGQVWINGVTSVPGATPGLVAEVGYGPDGSMPVDTTNGQVNPAWTWFSTTFNTDVGNNDEFMGTLTVPTAGTYDYAYRYSWNGSPWLYADLDGTNNGYDPAQAGDLTVQVVAGTKKLLITEIVVTPTAGEFIEIYNPNADSVDLSNYYVTDATHAASGTYYYQVVEGGGGGGSFSDFDARFPDGAMIAPGEYQTIALDGDSLFFNEYGVLPTYELYEDSTNFANDVPDMREAVPGSINGQGGLTNGDEVVIMYYWDGLSDLVKDVDYLLYNSGSPTPNNEAVDKTGVAIDGPDPGTDSTMYLPDTPIANQVSAVNHGYGFSVHRTDFAEGTQVMTGGNGITGADETSEDLNNTFTNNSVPSPNAPWQVPLPPGVFLMEDFEGGGLPSGWTATSNGVGWLVGDSAALSSAFFQIPDHTIFAASNDDAPGSGNDGSMDYLILPRLDFSSAPAVVIQFASFYNGAYGQMAYVEVSEDGGTTWTKVDSLMPDPGWVMLDYDLSAYAGAGHDSVWVAFHADDGGAWASGWAVDDVVVKEKDVGTLSGTVTELSSGSPIDSALVTVNGNQVYTDPTGAYSFSPIFTGMYTMTVEKEGYNTATKDSVVVYKDSTTVVDFALTAPTIDLSVTVINDTLSAGDTLDVPITVSNNGNGPLDYSLVIWPTVVKRTDYSKFQNGGALSTAENRPVQKKVVKFKADASRGDSVVIHYDGPYGNNGIGTGGAASWICAARFTADELAAYYGSYSLTEIRFHIRDASFTNVTAKVWQGGSYRDPGVEVFSQDVTSSVIVGDWTNVMLPTPVPLISGQEYWIGYAIDATGDHPSSVDAGPMVPGKGAWMFFAGAWYELTELGASLNYNWNIRGVLRQGNSFWLSAAPVAGTILAGQNQVVTAKLDARVFANDTTVHANINFMSNPNVGAPVVPVTMTVAPRPVGLNPPRDLQAAAGDATVDLSWLRPLPFGELGYDDGTSETGFGLGGTGEFAVRFTPHIYPSTLLAIKTYWANITNPLDAVEYSVWVNPTGGDLPPATQVLANTPYTVPVRGQFSELDISANNIQINSGDFFYSWIQPDTINYGIGLDQNSPDAGRAWLSFDAGLTWSKLNSFGFDDNLMIRALVLEGSGPNARIVELEPEIVQPKKPQELIALKKANRHLFQVEIPAEGIVHNPAGSKLFDPMSILGTKDLQGYDIYRSEDNVTFTMLASTDTSTLVYTDNAVTNDSTYWYYVIAHYDEGLSAPSNVAMATPSAGVEPLMNLVHTPGSLNAAIFNDGSIGAENTGFTGPGVTWNGQNGIFVGGPIFGTGAVGSVNGYLGSFSVNADIKRVASNYAGGFMSDPNFDQITWAVFNDAFAPFPYGVDVVQKSYSNTGEEYVFIRYGYVNNSGAPLNDFYGGIFIDWDVGNYATNSGGYAPGINLVYQYDNGGPSPYFGIVGLDGWSGARTTPDTPPGGDPRIGSFIYITTFDPTIAPDGDFRSWIGTGPLSIAPGDTVWTTFAIVAGDSLAQLGANAVGAANKSYTVGWTGPLDLKALGLVPTVFDMKPNYPNPFNPTTTIKYQLPQAVNVHLDVYNVLGQRVKSLVNARKDAGFYEVVWDGTNDFGSKVASGIYIYRIQAGDFVKSYKMILMK